MLIDVVIPFGTELWRNMLISSALFIAGPIISSNYYPPANEIIRKCLGLLFIVTAISIHPYLLYIGTWNLKTSLPLQLCSLSGILSGFVLLYPTQRGYELMMYWGLPAAIHSLLTPEMTQGSGQIILAEYYLSHSGIILSALYLTYSCNMRLSKNSWIKIFLFTQLLLPVVGTIDYFLDANYMYLRTRPLVDSPFIIGEWPFYILILDAALFLHMAFVYILFYGIKKRSLKTPA